MRYATERFYTCPGSPIHDIYAPVVDEHGCVQLEVCDREDLQAFIDSFAESTDIHLLVARIRAGEEELLHRRPGAYGDFTQYPQTYAQALQMQINAQNAFDSLPLEVKQKFNNDPAQFLAQSGTQDWFEKIEPTLPVEVRESLSRSLRSSAPDAVRVSESEVSVDAS